jgi:hypothetical protein
VTQVRAQHKAAPATPGDSRIRWHRYPLLAACNGKAIQRSPQTQEMAFCVMRCAHDSIRESTGSSLQSRKAPEAMSMSDQDDWEFGGPKDAKAEIRAAVEYLLRDATGGTRGDIVQEIITIVRQAASGLPPEQGNPLDDDMPGG